MGKMERELIERKNKDSGTVFLPVFVLGEFMNI